MPHARLCLSDVRGLAAPGRKAPDPCCGADVPLLLVDLDSTLVDRAGAFARWAREFASARGGSAADARAAGWVPFVATNGTVEQQERKLRLTCLEREVAGWVISEGRLR
jgi:hypothetical protein